MADLPPGPRGIAALRSLERMRVDILPELESLQARWGDVVHLRAPGVRYVVLFHPDDVEQVHVTSAASVRKGFAIRRSGALLGRGLITSEGSFHREQRRVVQPSVQGRRVARYAEAMVEETDRMLAGFPAGGGVIDVERSLGRLGLAIIGRTMLGSSLDEEADAVYRALDVVRHRFAAMLLPLAPLAQALPLPASVAFRRARRTLRGVVEAGVRERVARGVRVAAEDDDDLLGMLLAHRAEATGEQMPRRQVVDEGLAMLLAGHETVANTLAWTLHLLARHPEVRDRLEAEVDSVLGSRAPTAADLDELPLTRAVFLETLRLYPQCYAMTRTALEQFDCPNLRVERGWEIVVPQWSIHRDPRWWEEPATFRPERFFEDLLGNRSPSRPRYAYFPFSGGARACIGRHFSMLEGAVVLARVAQRVRFDELQGAPAPRPHAMFTLWPGPLRMRAVPRSPVGVPAPA